MNEPDGRNCQLADEIGSPTGERPQQLGAMALLQAAKIADCDRGVSFSLPVLCSRL